MSRIFNRCCIEKARDNLLRELGKKVVVLLGEVTSHNNILSHIFITELLSSIPINVNIVFMVEDSVPINWNEQNWSPVNDLKTHQCQSSRSYYDMLDNLKKQKNVSVEFVDLRYNQVFNESVTKLSEEHIGLFNVIRDRVVANSIIKLLKNHSNNTLYISYFGIFHFAKYEISIDDLLNIKRKSSVVDDLKKEYRSLAYETLRNYNISNYLDAEGINSNLIYMVCRKGISNIPLGLNKELVKIIYNKEKIRAIQFNEFYCDYPMVFDYPYLKVDDVNQITKNKYCFTIDSKKWNEKSIARNYLQTARLVSKMDESFKRFFLTQFCYVKECYESSNVTSFFIRDILFNLFCITKGTGLNKKMLHIIFEESIYYDNSILERMIKECHVSILLKFNLTILMKYKVLGFVIFLYNKLVVSMFPHQWLRIYFNTRIDERFL